MRGGKNNMDFIAHRGEMIIMDDESCYLVLKNIEYNGEAYLRVIKTGDYIFEHNFEVNKAQDLYLKEIVENDECLYDFVKDVETIKALKAL